MQLKYVKSFAKLYTFLDSSVNISLTEILYSTYKKGHKFNYCNGIFIKLFFNLKVLLTSLITVCLRTFILKRNSLN